MKPTPVPINFNTPNMVIVVVGVVILAIGLYRIFPLQFTKGLFIMNGPLVIMLAVSLMILKANHQPDSFEVAAKKTAVLAGSFLPLMVVLCMVMGLGSVIAKIHEVKIQAFLTENPIIGPFVAAFITPTSNALVAIVETAWKDPKLRPMCLYYLIASVLGSLPLFMLRSFGFTDPGLKTRMIVSGVILSVILLFLMKPLYLVTEFACTVGSTLWQHAKTAFAICL